MVRNLRHNKLVGREFHFYKAIDSSQSEAKRLARSSHIESGAVVFSEFQNSGYGRRHSAWVSNSAENLTFTIVWILENNLQKIQAFPYICANSIVDAIWKTSRIRAGTKWPNDILVNEKKIAGTLIETTTLLNRLFLFIGIGLNVNQNYWPFDGNLQVGASSLRVLKGEVQNRQNILLQIFDEFEKNVQMTEPETRQRWQNNCLHKDKEICFHSNKKVHGIFRGLNEDFRANIEIAGELQNFSNGTTSIPDYRRN